MEASADGHKAHIRIKDLPVLELRLKRPLPDSEALRSLRLVQRPNGKARRPDKGQVDTGAYCPVGTLATL